MNAKSTIALLEQIARLQASDEGQSQEGADDATQTLDGLIRRAREVLATSEGHAPAFDDTAPGLPGEGIDILRRCLKVAVGDDAKDWQDADGVPVGPILVAAIAGDVATALRELEAYEAANAAAQACPCGLETCEESWEPGCGLGSSPEHTVVGTPAPPERRDAPAQNGVN